MPIWLVICESTYYPMGGTGDWKLMTNDHDEALGFFAGSTADFTTLVRIDGTQYTTEDYRTNDEH